MKEWMKRIRDSKPVQWLGQYPLFLMLAVSGFLLGGVGLLGSAQEYLPYRQESYGSLPISWVFLGIKDGIYPWDVALSHAEDPEEEAFGTQEGIEKGEAGAEEAGSEANTEEAGSETDTEGAAGVTDSRGTAEGGSPMPGQETARAVSEEAQGGGPGQVKENSPAGEEAAPTYEFETVDESYFDDALFIGDSRTVGLWEYAGMEERADFFCKTSLTVWDILEKPFVKTQDGKNVTLEEALQDKSYGKIYLMVGINELGRGNTELFMEEYVRVVERLKELQPDAILFVEGIMRVAGEKNRTDPIFNNTHINEKNENIAKLADNRTIFYIDVNEAVCDENGDLIADYTFDQIHLKAAYYELWKTFLLEHGIVRED